MALEAILPQVDNSELGPDDEFDIENEVIDIAPNWKGFGKALHLPPNSLDRIAAQPGANPETCLSNTLTAFLKKNYEWNKYGVPSWRMIVQAVGHKIGGRDENLALRIAENHKIPGSGAGTSGGASSVSTTSAPAKTPTHPALQERPSMKVIGRIQYTKKNETKQLRLIDSVTGDWEDVARQLDFDEAKITTFRRAHPADPKGAANAMLSSWTRSDTEATWAKLIQALEGATDELAGVAKTFEYALIHKEE